MTRIEFIKRDALRIAILLILTLVLPLMADWHNPAGAQPLTVFGFLAMLGWIGFIGMMVLPYKARGEFFDHVKPTR